MMTDDVTWTWTSSGHQVILLLVSVHRFHSLLLLVGKTSQYEGGTPRSAPRVAPGPRTAPSSPRGGPTPPHTEFCRVTRITTSENSVLTPHKIL